MRSSRREDLAAIRALTAAAFADVTHRTPSVDGTGQPGEAALVEWLLVELPEDDLISLVVDGDERSVPLLGHVVCSRGWVGERPALGLGPISVAPSHQRRGVGSTLVSAALEAAEARGEPLVALLGDPGYYGRFGFVPAATVGVLAPDEVWGNAFQVRLLDGHDPSCVGRFRYSEPFDRLG